MRLAFVSPRFAEGATVGGAETLLRRLAEHAAAAGHRVTFLATCAQNHFTWANEVPAGTRQLNGIEVIRFPVDESRDVAEFLRLQARIDRREELTPGEEERWLKNSVNSPALCDHLRVHAAEYDRVIAGPYLFGLTWAVSRVLPDKTLLLPCLHDEPFAYLQTMRAMFRQARGCLFNAAPEQDLAGRLYDLPPGRGRVVGMGLDLFDADPADAGRLGLAAPYVIYCGRRETGKGTPLLCAYLDAFRQRTGRDVKLALTGSGPVEAPPSLQPHIRDLGFVTEAEKQAALAGALAFVHPSVNESFGIVLLEAWTARVPALVHAGSAVLRWQCAQAGGGLWFRHYPDFEEQLLYLMDHEPLRRQLGAQGRAYVAREYAWPAVESRFGRALEEL